jgi:hypothetical protein
MVKRMLASKHEGFNGGEGYSRSREELTGRNRRETQTKLARRIPSHKTQVIASRLLSIMLSLCKAALMR